MNNPVKTMFVFIALISVAANAEGIQASEVTALFEHLNVGMQPGAAVMIIREGVIPDIC